MDGVKAGFGLDASTEQLTYRELQARRALIQKRMRDQSVASFTLVSLDANANRFSGFADLYDSGSSRAADGARRRHQPLRRRPAGVVGRPRLRHRVVDAMGGGLVRPRWSVSSPATTCACGPQPSPS